MFVRPLSTTCISAIYIHTYIHISVTVCVHVCMYTCNFCCCYFRRNAIKLRLHWNNDVNAALQQNAVSAKITTTTMNCTSIHFSNICTTIKTNKKQTNQHLLQWTAYIVFVHVEFARVRAERRAAVKCSLAIIYTNYFSILVNDIELLFCTFSITKFVYFKYSS